MTADCSVRTPPMTDWVSLMLATTVAMALSAVTKAILA